MYSTRSIRIVGVNDPGVSSLDSSLKDRHVGWNPTSKFRYMKAIPEELVEIRRVKNTEVHSIAQGPVGGPGGCGNDSHPDFLRSMSPW